MGFGLFGGHQQIAPKAKPKASPKTVGAPSTKKLVLPISTPFWGTCVKGIYHHILMELEPQKFTALVTFDLSDVDLYTCLWVCAGIHKMRRMRRPRDGTVVQLSLDIRDEYFRRGRPLKDGYADNKDFFQECFGRSYEYWININGGPQECAGPLVDGHPVSVGQKQQGTQLTADFNGRVNNDEDWVKYIGTKVGQISRFQNFDAQPLNQNEPSSSSTGFSRPQYSPSLSRQSTQGLSNDSSLALVDPNDVSNQNINQQNIQDQNYNKRSRDVDSDEDMASRPMSPNTFRARFCFSPPPQIHNSFNEWEQKMLRKKKLKMQVWW